jgi:hypothetical protein
MKPRKTVELDPSFIHDPRLQMLDAEGRWVWVEMVFAMQLAPKYGYLMVGDRHVGLAEFYALVCVRLGYGFDRASDRASDRAKLLRDLGLVKEADGKVWCDSMLRRHALCKKRSVAGVIGGGKHKAFLIEQKFKQQLSADAAKDLSATASGAENHKGFPPHPQSQSVYPINSNPEDQEKKLQEKINRLNKYKIIHAAFEVFWKTYPKRHGSNPKAPARKKFELMIVNGVATAEEMIAGARAYADQCEKLGTEPEFVAMVTTWINQRRWQDEYGVANSQKKIPFFGVPKDLYVDTQQPTERGSK